MTLKEILPIIFGSGALGVLGKALVDYYRNRKKDKAEAGKLEADTGKTVTDQAKSLAEAALSVISTKVMAENIWKEYASKVEGNYDELKTEYHDLKRELQTCQIEFRKLREELDELKSKPQ